MRGNLEYFIAWRYLRSSKKEGFVSVVAWFSFAGIAIGVATLIIVMSVMNGFRHELMHRVLGFNGHITVYATLSQQEQVTLTQLPDVRWSTPILQRGALCMHQRNTAGVLIRGLPPEEMSKRPLLSNNIIAGNLDHLENRNSVMLGHKLARRLSIKAGDRLKILSGEGTVTALGVLPKSRYFSVAAIFDTGMYEYDSSFIFMSLENAWNFFDLPASPSEFELFAKDPNNLSSIKQDLYRLFPEAVIQDWQQTHGQFFNAIQAQRNIMFIILTLMVMVAVFNIISCLVMLVKDKTKDIAILRVLGATQGQVMRIFMVTGSSIGLLGTVTGAVIGVLFSYYIDTIRLGLERLTGSQLFQAEVYFLSKLPSEIYGKEVALLVGVSLLLSFLSTLYPAWKASRLSPVEGLRYE